MREVKDGLIEDVIARSVDMEGSLEDVIIRLHSMKKLYPDHKNLRLDIEYGDYDDSRYIVLRGDREATPAEVKAWEEEKAETEKNAEKWERVQYEALKKKFEK